MTCLLDYDRDCFGKYCEVKDELKFEDNFTAFRFYFVNCNWRWTNGNSNNCSQGKASAVTFPSHIKAIQTRGLQVLVGKVPSSAIYFYFIYLFVLYFTLTIQLKTLFTNYLAIELLIYVNHLSKKPILRKIKGKIYSWVYIHTKYTTICKKVECYFFYYYCQYKCSASSSISKIETIYYLTRLYPSR